VNAAPDAQFNKEIASYIDVDAFFKFMAATAIIANLDSFFGMGHNYCLYLHPETNKFHFTRGISTWRWAASAVRHTGTANGFESHQALRRPVQVGERLLANKEFADNYQQILKEVVPLCFAKEKVLAEIATLEKVVKPLIEKETKAVAARKEGGGGFGPPGMGDPVGWGRSGDLRRT